MWLFYDTSSFVACNWMLKFGQQMVPCLIASNASKLSLNDFSTIASYWVSGSESFSFFITNNHQNFTQAATSPTQPTQTTKWPTINVSSISPGFMFYSCLAAWSQWNNLHKNLVHAGQIKWETPFKVNYHYNMLLTNAVQIIIFLDKWGFHSK